MTALQVFANPDFGEIRTTVMDNAPWFVGKDVAKALGYKYPSQVVRDKVDAEDRGVGEMATPSGNQQMTIINESGLYSLILSSKLPAAKKFKRWVTSEVLPAIRRQGSYTAQPMTQAQLIAAQAQVLVDLERRMDAVETQLAALPPAPRMPKVVDSWRDEMMHRVRLLCHERRLNLPPTLGRMYKALELRTGCMLASRLKRLRQRARKGGMPRKKALALGKMDAIAADKKLRAAFEDIVATW